MDNFTKFLDLEDAYIPFAVQCTDGTGVKTSPTEDSLIIYEIDGSNGTNIVATDDIENSPFDPVQLPTDVGKVGLWGLKIAKTNFTAGKYYLFLWELTVDGKATAVQQIYHFKNSSDVKANISTLAIEANVQGHAAAAITADAKIEFIKQINGGRWKIVGNQMIFYKEDNTTVIAIFNLFDQNGNPSMVNVFDRQKV